jgi:PAS domain S-box-containing protein
MTRHPARDTLSFIYPQIALVISRTCMQSTVLDRMSPGNKQEPSAGESAGSQPDRIRSGVYHGMPAPGRIRVLYVDDEPDLLDLARIFLEFDGEFSVDTAVSAPEARTILAGNTYDAIVSDYQMPEEDGIAFLKSVRALHEDIPFLLFTGRGRENVVVEAIDNGVDFYVQKGGDPKAQFAELAHKIRQAVIRRQLAAKRRLAEEALVESEAKFSMLFQNNPAILTLIDAADNTFVDVNDAFVRYLGYSREDVLGKTMESAGIHVEIPGSGTIAAELRDTSRVSAREVRFRTKTGEISTCLFSIVVITMGSNSYYLTSAEDISERTAMETELREKQVLLEEAMALANLAEWDVDGRTGEFVFNDRFYALYGTTAGREGGYRMDQGTYLREFVHPDDRDAVMQEIGKETFVTDRNYEFFIRHRIVRRDGAIRALIVRMKVERDAGGKIVRMHGVNQDVTGRK